MSGKQAQQTQRKDRIDLSGAGWLLSFSVLMGINQVFIKLVNQGMSPMFQAGLRSACALVLVVAYAMWAKRKLSITDGSFWPGIFCGFLFAGEFILTFIAFEFTTVGRATMLYYTMPFWLACIAHFTIPGERLTLIRLLGLVLALGGVGWALLRNDNPATEYAIWGDLMCILAAMGWAGIALTVRLTDLSKSTPEMQLIYQLAVSAVVILALAPLYGDFIRNFTMATGAMFSFQVVVVVCFAFLMWFKILAVYPASDMASFGFLTPLFGVFFGWLILGEQLTWQFGAALALVCLGVFLVNRKPKSASKH